MPNKLYFYLFIFLWIPLTLYGQGKENLKFLSYTEINWLQRLERKIKVGVTQIPNQVLIDKKSKYRGFSIDLFKLIEKKFNLHFQFINYPSWESLVEATQKEEIDILFLAQKTPSRLNYLYFTDTVLIQQNKLIVHIDRAFHSLDELKGYRIAITSGSAIEEYLRHYYPKILLVTTQNEKEALEYVAQKRADATVLEVVRASYYMSELNLNNLRITSDIDYNYYLSVATVRSLPELNIILSKSIQHIPQEELEALKLKWGYIKEKKLFFDKETMIYISIVFGIVLPFSIYLSIINARLQEEMRQKQKALERIIKLRDSKLNEMGEIVSMIAHQWRQPLHNLSLLIQLTHSKYKRDKLNKESIDHFLQNATLQVEMMSKTIEDFIHFFKVTETKERFDVKETIENLLHITKPLFKKEGIRIEFKASDGKFFIENYQNALFQVVMNILTNAKEALSEQNPPTKKIEIALTKHQNETIVSIKDNAGGIPIEIIDKIFDPYFSTKKEKNGTGLGLYISKILIQEKMGGKIEYFNEKDGALFKLKFYNG